MAKKIFISSRSFGQVDTSAIDLLQQEGLETIINPYGKKLTEDEIIQLQDDAVGIIAGTEEINDNIMAHNKNLRVISRYGIGLNNIDTEAAKQRNVLIFNTPETPKISVAELTLTLMLTLLKKTHAVDQNLKNGVWKPEMGQLLSEKTIGIIGLGRIGKQLVRFLHPFSVKLIAYDVNPDTQFTSEYQIDMVSLDTLIRQSDIITIHAPLTKQTQYLIGESELRSMKTSALLINTARGGLIDEQALYTALKQNTIAGAAIDVFEHEPETGRLKELDNIILTPHIGTYTNETRKKMELEAAKNLIYGLKKIKIL